MSNIKRDYVIKYSTIGNDKFYRFLLSTAVFKLSSNLDDISNIGKLPDIELLELYEKFLLFYRRENDQVYLEIAILCRKAAHKLHRTLLRQKLVSKNAKFLTLVTIE